MRHSPAALLPMVMVVSCTDSSSPICVGFDAATCKAEEACQLAIQITSSPDHSGSFETVSCRPTALPIASAAACDTLDFGHCSQRHDCTLVFGNVATPAGFERCETT